MATMTQEEVDAWLGAHGGGQLQHGTEKKQIRNPSYNEVKGPTPSNPEYVTVDVETWTNSKTGAKLVAQHLPDGSWERHDAVDADPSKPSTTGPQRTPEQTTVDAAAASKATEDERERAYHRALGHGNLTHAEYEAKLDKDQLQAQQAATQARADKNQERLTAAQEAQNQIQRDRLQLDKDKQSLPDVKPETITVNGQRYTRTTITDPRTGATRVINLDPAGKPVDRIPGEGELSAGGPPMPHFIATTAAQALTEYHAALAADPNQTPESRAKHFQEANQAAQLAIQQAATEQRERESQRNTAYNVASTKANYAQTGMGQALDFVSKLNGQLPVGSNLGGQAFAALLGLQMLQMSTTGIDNLPKVTAADVLTPRGVATARAVVTPALQAATAPPAAPAPAASMSPSSAAPGAAPVAPRPVAPAIAPPQGNTTPGTRDNYPPAPSSASATLTVRHKATGTTGEVTQAEWDANPASHADWEIIPAGSATPESRGIPVVPPAVPLSPALQNELGKPGDPNYGNPTLPPAAGNPGAPVQMAPPSGQQDFNVLANVPRYAPPAPEQPQSAAPAAVDYPAMLHTQAATQVPWQMDENTYRRYKVAGVPDEVIWSVPPIGVMAA